jgi:hypothetical protein
LEES